jgi:hypothetical protein
MIQLCFIIFERPYFMDYDPRRGMFRFPEKEITKISICIQNQIKDKGEYFRKL